MISMYYTQIIRPLDSGAMLNRAAACLSFMLANRDINYNEWEGDMKSRYVHFRSPWMLLI
jgi:hypothetical protein